MLTLPRETTHDFWETVKREWLVTNGIGGYAMGAVNGTRTRRYHGMLVAALQPPTGRWLMAVRVADGFGSDLAEFLLDGSVPLWTYRRGIRIIEKRVWMQHGANTSYVRYTLARGDAPLTLYTRAAADFRDHHGLSAQHEDRPAVERVEHGFQITVRDGAQPVRLLCGSGDWIALREWTLNEMLPVEAERGFDFREDTLTVASHFAYLNPGDSITLVLSAEESPNLDGEAALAERRARDRDLIEQAQAADAPIEIQQLVLAADQFVVRRTLDDGTPGSSVIAGYPWFGDWGRDTMISLPGLTLVTGRYDIARGILTTFARYVDQGMLPNRFPDSGEQPEYNTADATLWYFEAVRAYFAASGDLETVRALFPVLQDIVLHHVKGTRYGIKVDPDGLLRAGGGSDNLTWMDAKVDGVPMTPRHGKPVEICGLWINALAVMRDFAAALGQSGEAYAAMYEKAASSFGRFWDKRRSYLRDVLDPDDLTLRPNQLIAAMLPAVPLTTVQLQRIVAVCQEKLYTPNGMRTLPSEHPEYRGVYVGDARTRDAMYHQGPSWSWLIGPFLSAHLRAYGDRDAVRGLLDRALKHLYDGCAGSVSELFDGDPPHHPRAACAQAWGVAELLRVWKQVEG